MKNVQVILLILLSLTLVACGEQISPVEEQKRLSDLKESISSLQTKEENLQKKISRLNEDRIQLKNELLSLVEKKRRLSKLPLEINAFILYLYQPHKLAVIAPEIGFRVLTIQVYGLECPKTNWDQNNLNTLNTQFPSGEAVLQLPKWTGFSKNSSPKQAYVQLPNGKQYGQILLKQGICREKKDHPFKTVYGGLSVDTALKYIQ